MFAVILMAITIATPSVWKLAMNINPSDGNTMDYCNTLWYHDVQHGNTSTMLSRDFVSKSVRRIPVNRIAIVRHNIGRPDCVRVWKFKDTLSLLKWFNSGTRNTVTVGGYVYEELPTAAKNQSDDPIFSKGGNLIFNYEYTDNGVRIVMSESHLSAVDGNDDNTHGIGMDWYKNSRDEEGCTSVSPICLVEVAAIQDCPLILPEGILCAAKKILGTDSTGDNGYCRFEKVKDYGSYAIYVGNNSDLFPLLRQIGSLGSIMLSSMFKYLN